MFFFYVFAVGPLVYYAYPGVWEQIRWTYALSLLANWYLCIVVFYRTHRRLYPQRWTRRCKQVVTMLISPLTAK